MIKKRIIEIAIVVGVTVAAAGPAFAGKPDEPGNSRAQKSSQQSPAGSPANQDTDDSRAYFNTDRRTLIRNYYSKTQNRGNCPPVLAKKNNGCQPPGQVKKWRNGESLPRDVVYYDLPGALLEELGYTPDGDKLVQIDTDLLLIDIATGMVLDAFDVQE